MRRGPHMSSPSLKASPPFDLRVDIPVNWGGTVVWGELPGSTPSTCESTHCDERAQSTQRAPRSCALSAVGNGKRAQGRAAKGDWVGRDHVPAPVEGRVRKRENRVDLAVLRIFTVQAIYRLQYVREVCRLHMRPATIAVGNFELTSLLYNLRCARQSYF